MPWYTPTLREVRSLVRDHVRSSLPGADASVPNSVLRVMSDAQGALCHLNLQYLDWLALQLMPDTAETEWLDRHGHIWLVNSDGSTGRKLATFASGTVTMTGTQGTVVPAGTQLSGEVGYETTQQIVVGASATPALVRALDAGIAGNVPFGTVLDVIAAVPGLDGAASVVVMDGGVDAESDDQLRMRVLQRIRNPPMGGAKADYVTWALSVPGVTRAWAEPEQGIGTITVRFLMDDLRGYDDGWPTASDVQAVHNYINQKRPVTVKDCYVLAPIKQHIYIQVVNLVPNNEEIRNEIIKSVQDMLHELAAPGQTIFNSWVSYAIMNAPGVQSFNLTYCGDWVMASRGHMAVYGYIWT